VARPRRFHNALCIKFEEDVPLKPLPGAEENFKLLCGHLGHKRDELTKVCYVALVLICILLCLPQGTEIVCFSNKLFALVSGASSWSHLSLESIRLSSEIRLFLRTRKVIFGDQNIE